MIGFNHIKAIIIFDLKGQRVLAKYYDESSLPVRSTKKFEQQLFTKTRTSKAKGEIFLIENSLAIHRLICDHHIYVVGARDENPMVLDKTLNCLVESISTLINNNPDYKTFHDNLDQIILALDEICEQGTLLEVDPELVIDRVSSQVGMGEQQSLTQVLQSAADMWTPWMRS